MVLVQPTAEDLAVIGPNLMSRKRRQQVIELARRTVAEQINQPHNRVLLDGLPEGDPYLVRRPSGPPSEWPAIREAATRREAMEGRVSELSEREIAERAASNGHAGNGSGGSVASGRLQALGRLSGAIAEEVQRRIPRADLDERDPDYIRDSLPGLWLLASFYFRADVRGLERNPRDGPGAAGGQPLGRQHDTRHAGVHAGLQHLLRRGAALLPAGPQPGAAHAGALNAAQVRDGGGIPRERPQGARLGLGTARLPGRRLRGAPPHVGVGPGGFRGPEGLPAPGHRARRADRAGGGHRRPGDGALPQPRRVAREVPAAGPPVQAQGAADLPRGAVGPEHGRHARPLPAAFQDHDPGARPDRPARGVRVPARTSTRSTKRCSTGCRWRSTASSASDGFRCSADASRGEDPDRGRPRGGLGRGLGAARLPALDGGRDPLGRRRARTAAGSARASTCACTWAPPTSAGSSRWWSGTSPATSPGPTSRDSTTAAAGGCGERPEGTLVTFRLAYQSPGGLLGRGHRPGVRAARAKESPQLARATQAF